MTFDEDEGVHKFGDLPRLAEPGAEVEAEQMCEECLASEAPCDCRSIMNTEPHASFVAMDHNLVPNLGTGQKISM